jgi:hypothetical protein
MTNYAGPALRAAADGTVIASVVFRATEHTTVTPDGQTRVSFERGRLTCS